MQGLPRGLRRYLVEPVGGASRVAGLLGANTEAGDGDPFPASCSVYAGRVRTGAFQSFHVSELWGEEGRRVRREKQGLYVRSELS